LSLGEEQKQALQDLQRFLADPEGELHLLEGFAGTGKSTLCSLLLGQHPGLRVAFCATTNKAAKVLASMVARDDDKPLCCTIHRLLKLVPEELNGGFRCRQVAEPDLSALDLVVVDECSMINQELWNFIQDIPCISKAKVLLLGDPAQLPPVGELDSPCFSLPWKSRLQQVFRQGQDHPILAHSAKLRLAMDDENLPIPLPVESEQVQLFTDQGKWCEAWEARCRHHNSQWQVDRVRLLTWTNRRVERWNRWLKPRLYPEVETPFHPDQALVLTSPLLEGGWSSPRRVKMPCDEAVRIRRMEPLSWRGLKLWRLAVENDEGSVGELTYVSPEQEEDVQAQLQAWRMERAGGLVGSSIQDWESAKVGVQSAHAITVHRSQGSSFDEVFLDLPSLLSNPRRKECLQLLYVAVTRARQRLWVLMPKGSQGQ
jgi:hypothetical protein